LKNKELTVIKLVRESLTEGYGAGYSFTGGGFRGGLGGTSRGGFGGAYNSGGPNLMYTYEIKPLNHSLEPKPSDTFDQLETIKVGSKIMGRPIRSNAAPDEGKKITGIVHQIAETDDHSIKYYVVQDEATQTHVKIDPLTVTLIKYEPIRYTYATDNIPSRRAEKLKAAMQNQKIVRESIEI